MNRKGSVGVRLVTAVSLTDAQLKGLQTAFSALAKIPRASLRASLRRWPVCVVGVVPREESAALLEVVTGLGVGVEFFTTEDYPSSVRALLPPAPPSFKGSATTLELQFRPSRSPEAILRFWKDGDVFRLQFASVHTSVWLRRFCYPLWLWNPAADEPDEPPEDPQTETVEVPGFAELLQAGLRLNEPGEAAGIDGMTVEIDARAGDARAVNAVWSPAKGTDAYAILNMACELAQGLRDRKSRQRLAELKGYIGVGDAL
ncbi:MAG: hypothetical protein AAGE52_41270 [Myxococcota bacterium]